MESKELGGTSRTVDWENEKSSLVLNSEDEEDILSSIKEDGTSIEARLEKFRDNWKKEIKMKATSPENQNISRLKPPSDRSTSEVHVDHVSDESSVKSTSEMELQAMALFQKASNLESSGKLYDAVAYYRRATQLVPDIEARVYSKEKAKRDERKLKKANPKEDLDNEKSQIDSKIGDDLEEEDNLLVKFNFLNIDDDGNFFICKPANPTRSTHFSDLPHEVVLYILHWIVSDELDMISLENFGQVCRGFYVLSRDPEIWKLACLRIWPVGCVDKTTISDYNDDWRIMFIERPRVNVNGAYISRASYVRQGEASFQDVNYRPCYLVEYYRYLRFFPGGLILMLNTPDDPYQTLAKLKTQNASYHAIVRGHYIIQGSKISAILKSRNTSVERITHGKRGHKNRLIVAEKEYHLLLEIRNGRKGRNNQLSWLSYTVISKKNDQDESINTFDLNVNKFPPFWFSRVRSYGFTAMAPLL